VGVLTLRLRRRSDGNPHGVALIPAGRWRIGDRLFFARSSRMKRGRDVGENACPTDATVANIALVKPDRARQVEDLLISNAQMGRIAEQVDEAKLISFLEQINERMQTQTKVIVCPPPQLKRLKIYSLNISCTPI
jgi:hypothetical protein